MLKVQQYRKKPLVIEAFIYEAGMLQNTLIAPGWVFSAIETKKLFETGDGAFIRTLEGDMRLEPGDYVIQGIKGEIYPCKAEIFQGSYDPVAEPGFDPHVSNAELAT